MLLFRKFLVPLIGLLMLFSLCDCGVEMITSLHPIYTRDTLIRVPELEGGWQAEGEGYSIVVTFSRQRQKSYLMEYKRVSLDGDILQEAPFTAHLAKIGEHTFLDIYSKKGPQRDRLMVKMDKEAFDEAVERSTRYGIGISGEIKQYETGAFFIHRVGLGSPAYLGGLKVGDRIIKINDHSVEGVTWEELRSYALGPQGSEVTYTISREGEVEPLEFTLFRNYWLNPWINGEMPENELGVGIMVASSYTALTIDTVHSDSAADRAGLSAGDHITLVNRRSIERMSQEDTLHQLEGPKESQIEIVVLHAGSLIPVTYSLNRNWPPEKHKKEDTDKTLTVERLAEKKGPYAKLYSRLWLGSHLFVRVDIGKGSLSIVPISGGWLFSLLKEQPDVLPVAGVMEADIVVLNATSGELHRFLLEYGGSKEAFPEKKTYVFNRLNSD